MTDGTLLEFSSLPNAAKVLPRVLFGRKPALLPEGRSVPRIEARCSGVMPDRATVAAYRQVCGFPDGEHLPVSIPHILAHPLHMEMVTHPRFPLGLLGLVHVQNSIVQYRPIKNRELLDWQSVIEGHRDTERGQEFELRTWVRAGDELVWEECSTMLARKRSRGDQPRKDKPRASEGIERAQLTSFAAPGDIGRRYARVSGDYNPIHLSAITARAFGFPKAIAHGMWSLARIAAELGPQWPEGKTRFDVAFKLPILLPAWVMLQSRKDGERIRFELRDDAGQRPHVVGTVEPLF